MKNKATFHFLAAFTLLVMSCSESSTVNGITANTQTLNDIYRTISTGDSLSFNNLTGGVSDLALHPITGAPAITYYDKSAPVSGTTAVGALKYAYMDANGTWNIEVVDANYGTAACGTANSYCVGAPNAAGGSTSSILRLAFKSDGTPAIAYVFGASANTVGGNKQLRLAERSTAGKWSISAPFYSLTDADPANVAVAATVDPMKGLTLNFDASDRPHITFTLYTQTITNSEVRYLGRNSKNEWTSSAITSAVTGAGDITALGQGTEQSGGVRCTATDKMLWTGKVVTATAGSGQPLFMSCTTVEDGVCTAFSTLDLAAGCTAASCFSAAVTTATEGGTRTDIVIDAATQRPIIGFYTETTPATSLLTTTAPSACSATQSTAAGGWGAPVVVGAASEGANGFRLAASTGTTNFLAYLTSTTDVMMNKATGPAGAWLATGTIVETATVAGEGVGAAYDTEHDTFYVSYAAVPAGAAGNAGNDIKVGYGSTDDLTNAGAAGTIAIENVDNTVNFFPTTAIPMLTAAKSASGLYGYAYFYQDATAADSKLYYGVRGGTAAAPVFSSHTVVNHVEGAASPEFVGSYPSLAYDSGNNPIIAFYDGVNTRQNLSVARSSDGGASFAVAVVDDIAANVGQYPSAATFGTTVGVAYRDVTNTGLKFAKFTPGKGWRRFAVDGMAGTGSCGNAAHDSGAHSVLRFTAAGQPVIAYKSQTGLKLAYAPETIDSRTYTWKCVSLDPSAATRGDGISMELGLSGEPHIVHFDSTFGAIRYVTCASDAATCLTAGSSSFTGTLLKTVGTTALIATRPSLKLDASGNLYVSFYSQSEQAVGLAGRGATSTTWSFEYIDQYSAGSTFVSSVGQHAQLLINESGFPMLFYRSQENWLRYFSRELF